MKLLSAVVAIFLLTRLSVAQVIEHQFKILKYELNIVPYFLRSDGSQKGTFKGEAEISLCYNQKVASKDIVFSSEGLEYNETEVFYVSAERELERTVSIDSKHLTITILEEFRYNSEYMVKLTFSGRMGPQKGLQMLSFTGPNGVIHYIVWTKMDMSKARTVFPHFTQPEWRNVFHISIVCPRDYRSYSNAPLGDSENTTDSRRKDWFRPTPNIPAYMVSMIVIKLGGAFSQGPLVLSQKYLDSITGDGRDVINNTRKYYAELFQGTGYNPTGPLIGIFNLARGAVIQTPGLGFCDEEILTSTIDDRPMAVTDEQAMKTKISSAEAQAYFANAINPEFWEHDWVKNGLAIYYEYLETHEMYPKYRLDIQFVTDVMHRAMHAGDLLVNFPMRYNKDLETSYVDSVLNSLRNAKAASFLRMISHAITKPRFNTMMKDFISENYLSTYTSKDFFESMIVNWPYKPVLMDRDSFLDEWLNCYDIPVISVNLSNDNKSAHLVQKTNITSNKQNKVITIPISYTTNIDRGFGNTVPSLYMLSTYKPVVVTFERPVEWIIVNIQQSGLYRVLYTEQIYKAIGKELKELGKNNFTEIHQLNRAQLIDDLFSFYIRQFVSSETIIEFLRYLRNEYDFAPWKAAMKGFIYLSTILDPEDLTRLGKFVLFLSENVYKKLGLSPKKNDNVLDRHLRNIIINANCRFGHKNLTQKAVDKIKDFLYDLTPMSNDIFATVICCAVRTKDKTLYLDIVDNFHEMEPPKMRRKVLDGLACVRTPLAIESYFNRTLTGEIAVEDKEEHLYKLLRENPDSAWFVYQLIMRDIKRYANVLQNKPRLAQVMYNIGILLNDEHQWNYWKIMMNKNQALFINNSLAITSAYDVQDLHSRWKINEYPKLKEILQKEKI